MFYILNARFFSVLQQDWQLCGSLGNFFFLSSSSWLSRLWKTSLNPAPLSPAYRICCLPINKGLVNLGRILFFLLSFSLSLAGHCWALQGECLGCLVSGDPSRSSCPTSFSRPILLNSHNDLKVISLNSPFPLTSFNSLLPCTSFGC